MDPIARSAAENFRTPQPIIEEFTFKDERVNRYVWYAGEDVPWPEIKGGFIKRCRVTPIVSFLVWERINDVPEDMRLAVRRYWMDPSHSEAQYEIRPQGIFESIMAQYGILGVRELTALKGKPEQEVAALKLDQTFCPWDDIPKPYSVIEDHIRRTLNGVNGNQLLRSVGEEMLGSIDASRDYDQQFVDFVESQKELRYSHPAFRALHRLDRRRRDHALNDMAAAQNKVFDKVPEILAAQQGMDPAIVELIKGQQAQIELLTKMVADKKAAKRARTRKPEPAHAE